MFFMIPGSVTKHVFEGESTFRHWDVSIFRCVEAFPGSRAFLWKTQANSGDHSATMFLSVFVFFLAFSLGLGI